MKQAPSIYIHTCMYCQYYYYRMRGRAETRGRIGEDPFADLYEAAVEHLDEDEVERFK